MGQVFSRETVFLLLLALAGEIIGNVYGFYRLFPAFDIVTHFIGGALVSSIAVKFLYNKLHRHSYFVNVVFTLGIGAFWEITEFTADLLFGLGMQGSLNDTMVDLVMVGLAAIIVNSIYSSKKQEPWV
ncbi:MAG: DUF2238 domain-containing protein [Candidatus Diapherotrites archaeon]|nr:DUF2238 domain-containing protein [Candidatus Diapherotrites archaeon]